MNILLIDDEQDVRRSLSAFLKKVGHAVTCAESGDEGLKEFYARPYDLVITDIRMPGMDGLELLRRLKQVQRSGVDVIIITGHGDMDKAVKALKYGAYDYLQKPVDVRELVITIERSEEYTALRHNYTKLKEEFRERVERETDVLRGEAGRLWDAYLSEIGLGDVCVTSDAMRAVLDQAQKYARDRAMPVLLLGESGTGKEVVARFLHHFGHAGKPAPFVAINCGAVSQELFEAELFGHERGAFTGAAPGGRMGKIEAAHGGTLFLDEIGEMPPSCQVKLLRVLEERKLYRVGGVKEIAVDVRVVSATNKDLAREVAEKRFRLDLYYRMNTGVIRIPSLRERREGIMPLAARFAGRAFACRGRRFSGFTPEAERLLVEFDWPGNVRQLKNVAEHAALLASGERIGVQDLSFVSSPAPLENPENRGRILSESGFDLPEGGLDLERLETGIIRLAMEKHGGNQTAAARYLGLSRRVLQGRLKKLDS